MHRGFIALYRKIEDHPFAQEKRVYSKYEAWLDLMMAAQYSTDVRSICVGSSVVECGYGQAVKSFREWGKKWRWDGKKVQRFFATLTQMGQISYESVSNITRVTILNYSKYDLKREMPQAMPHECHTNATDNTLKTKEINDALPQRCHKDATKMPQQSGLHLINTRNNVYTPKSSQPQIRETPHNPPPRIKDSGDTEIFNFVQKFQSDIKNELPKMAPKVTPELVMKGVDTLMKLIRIDGFEKMEVFDALRWSRTDDFWCNQIRSLAQIRSRSKNGSTKFQNMYAKWKSSNRQPQNGERTPNYRKMPDYNNINLMEGMCL